MPLPSPARVAAIDIGSNAIRFLAAEFTAPEAWTEIASARAAVRMGHEAFLTGRISAAAMDDAVAVLGGFRRRMDALGVARYRAVATSAVRESENGEEFVRRARKEAHVEVEPITGAEEARLTWLAIRQRVSMRDRDWVIADLGGGSLEISLVDAEHMEWTASYALGAVRLLESLGGEDAEDPARVRARLAAHPAMLRLREVGSEAPDVGLVAAGGNIDVLADLAEARADPGGVRRLSLRRLREIQELLAGMPVQARIERLGLSPNRADVIAPAAVVYERVAAVLGAAEIVVPGVGVKEGLLLEVGAAE